VEDIVWAELTRLTEEPPTREELERAFHREEADFLRSLDGMTERAYHLGAYEILGDWELLNAYLPNLKAVTPDLLVIAARQIFTDTNRTIGWFEPTKGQ